MVWLGWLDSNQRMRESKSRALPLGYTPIWGIKENMGLGFSPNPMFSMGWVMGLEPTTLGTTIRCSNQLSYTHHIVYPMENGTPEGTRTPGLLLRRQLLYPAELLAHMERVTRIELASPAWKAGALAIVLYPQVPSETNRQL